MAPRGNKTLKPRRTRRVPALPAWISRARPAAIGIAAVAATFGAGALVGLYVQHEPAALPVEVRIAAPPEPVSAPPASPPAPEATVPPPVPAAAAPSAILPKIIAPVPVPLAPPVLAAVLPPPFPPAQAPALAPPGSPLWLRNALPFNIPANRPLIAIVIDDMGLDRKRSNRVVHLPSPLTLAWLPYANDLPHQTKVARAAGHELLVHIPMQPLGGDVDPGPNAMTVGLGDAELLRRLEQGLKSFDGYIGVNNHMGSRFTEDRAGMKLVLSELQRRGLMFLDSRTTGHSVAPGIADDLRLPNLGRDVFLDNDMTPAAVRASLSLLENVARRKGYAIAIGHPHDVTVDALTAWLPTVAARGFTLVPVSAILKSRHTAG